MEYMKRARRVVRTAKHTSTPIDKRRIALIAGGVVFGIVTLIQLCYPAGKLLPFTRVDGMALGGVDRKEATAKLNTAYANHPIDIYMGSGTKPVTSPKLSAADMKVDNTARLSSLDYPWYLRIIPTSIMWAGLKSTPVPAPIIIMGVSPFSGKRNNLLGSTKTRTSSPSAKRSPSQPEAAPV